MGAFLSCSYQEQALGCNKQHPESPHLHQPGQGPKCLQGQDNPLKGYKNKGSWQNRRCWGFQCTTYTIVPNDPSNDHVSCQHLLMLPLVTIECLTLTPNVWQIDLANHTWSCDQLASITPNKHLSRGASPQSQLPKTVLSSPADTNMLTCCAQDDGTCDSLVSPLLTVHQRAHLHSELDH